MGDAREEVECSTTRLPLLVLPPLLPVLPPPVLPPVLPSLVLPPLQIFDVRLIAAWDAQGATMTPTVAPLEERGAATGTPPSR